MRQGATANDWLRAADEQLSAALVLRETHVRACVSRAYYAAYSICCACFEDRGLEKEPTPRGDDWWYPHASLASNLDLLLLDLAASGYNEWTEERLEALILDVLQLRSRREEADYRPERKPSITDALDAWNKAGTVMVALRPLIEVDEHA